jgi:hypothetical protein
MIATLQGQTTALAGQVAGILNAVATATPNVNINSMPTPDFTKAANASIQLTQVAIQQTQVSIQLTQLAIAQQALTPWATQVVGLSGGIYYTATPSVNVASQPTPNLTLVPSAAQGNAVSTSLASLDSKITRSDTGSVTVVTQPTPNLTLVPSSVQAAAISTSVGNASNHATTIDTNLQTILTAINGMATTLSALNTKTTAVNTGAVAGTVTLGTGVTVTSLPNVPQAQAAFTMIPTPVGQATPVPPMASGSGQQFCWPWVGRDNFTSYSAAVSGTTPVTIGTPAANMFFDLFPSSVNNTSSTAVAFTIKKGTTTLWSDTVAANGTNYIPLLTCGGTAAQPYIFTLGSAVTQVNWNGQYAQNYR